MSTHVTIRTDGRRAIAVKSGATTGALTALAREAATLQAIRHPSVVEFVRFDASDGLGELCTVFAGDQTLASNPPRQLGVIYRTVAALAAALADLHAMRVVHGRISADHVIIGPDGRPILCSFSEAGSIGEHLPNDTVRHPSQDVAALGALMADLIGQAEVSKLSRKSGSTRKRFERAVSDATDPDPRRRPTALDLAAAISILQDDPTDASNADDDPVALFDPFDPVPGIAQPTLADLAAARFGDVEPTEEPGHRFHAYPRRVAAVIAAIATAGVLVLALNAWLLPDNHPDATTEAEPILVTTIPVAASGTAPSTSAPSTTTTTQQEAQPLPSIQIDGVHFLLGEAGDVATTGDWDCDGEPTAALLRPSSGSIFVFDRWATDGEELTAAALTTVDGATGLRTQTDDQGCDQLIVESPTGDIPFILQPT